MTIDMTSQFLKNITVKVPAKRQDSLFFYSNFSRGGI